MCIRDRTQFSDEMLVRGGIQADFRAIAPRCRAMAAALAGSERDTLTTPQGTDLSFSAKGRRGNACLLYTSRCV